MTKKNHYTILGLELTATEKEIEKAYFKSVGKYLKRKSQVTLINNQEIKLLEEAYITLINPQRKVDYDRKIGNYQHPAFCEKNKNLKQAHILFKKGLKTYSMGYYKKAISFFQSAIKLNPKEPIYYTNLGLALSTQKGKLHEARDYCQKAIEIKPQKADFYINLGRVYKIAGLTNRSKICFKKAQSFDPYHPIILQKSCLLLKQGINTKFFFRKIFSLVSGY